MSSPSILLLVDQLANALWFQNIQSVPISPRCSFGKFILYEHLLGLTNTRRLPMTNLCHSEIDLDQNQDERVYSSHFWPIIELNLTSLAYAWSQIPSHQLNAQALMLLTKKITWLNSSNRCTSSKSDGSKDYLVVSLDNINQREGQQEIKNNGDQSSSINHTILIPMLTLLYCLSPFNTSLTLSHQPLEMKPSWLRFQPLPRLTFYMQRLISNDISNRANVQEMLSDNDTNRIHWQPIDLRRSSFYQFMPLTFEFSPTKLIDIENRELVKYLRSDYDLVHDIQSTTRSCMSSIITIQKAKSFMTIESHHLQWIHPLFTNRIPRIEHDLVHLLRYFHQMDRLWTFDQTGQHHESISNLEHDHDWYHHRLNRSDFFGLLKWPHAQLFNQDSGRLRRNQVQAICLGTIDQSYHNIYPTTNWLTNALSEFSNDNTLLNDHDRWRSHHKDQLDSIQLSFPSLDDPISNVENIQVARHEPAGRREIDHVFHNTTELALFRNHTHIQSPPSIDPIFDPSTDSNPMKQDTLCYLIFQILHGEMNVSQDQVNQFLNDYQRLLFQSAKSHFNSSVESTLFESIIQPQYLTWHENVLSHALEIQSKLQAMQSTMKRFGQSNSLIWLKGSLPTSGSSRVINSFILSFHHWMRTYQHQLLLCREEQIKRLDLLHDPAWPTSPPSQTLDHHHLLDSIHSPLPPSNGIGQAYNNIISQHLTPSLEPPSYRSKNNNLLHRFQSPSLQPFFTLNSFYIQLDFFTHRMLEFLSKGDTIKSGTIPPSHQVLSQLWGLCVDTEVDHSSSIQSFVRAIFSTSIKPLLDSIAKWVYLGKLSGEKTDHGDQMDFFIVSMSPKNSSLSPSSLSKCNMAQFNDLQWIRNHHNQQHGHELLVTASKKDEDLDAPYLLDKDRVPSFLQSHQNLIFKTGLLVQMLARIKNISKSSSAFKSQLEIPYPLKIDWNGYDGENELSTLKMDLGHDENPKDHLSSCSAKQKNVKDVESFPIHVENHLTFQEDTTCSNGTHDHQSIGILSDQWLPDLNRLNHIFFQETDPIAETARCVVPCCVAFRRSIIEPIRNHYIHLNSQLCQKLIKDLFLVRQIDQLRQNLSSELVDCTMDGLPCTTHWSSVQLVPSIDQQQRLFLQYLKMQRHTTEWIFQFDAHLKSNDLVDHLSIEYRQIKWPITMVITQEQIKIYNQFYRILVKIKRAISTLNELWLIMKKMPVKRHCHHHHDPVNHLQSIPLQPSSRNRCFQPTLTSISSHSTYLLIYELLFLCNRFYSFIANHVLHRHWSKMKDEMIKAGTIKKIIKFHQDYLYATTRSLFINEEEKTTVLTVLNKVMHLVDQFHLHVQQAIERSPKDKLNLFFNDKPEERMVVNDTIDQQDKSGDQITKMAETFSNYKTYLLNIIQHESNSIGLFP